MTGVLLGLVLLAAPSWAHPRTATPEEQQKIMDAINAVFAARNEAGELHQKWQQAYQHAKTDLSLVHDVNEL